MALRAGWNRTGWKHKSRTSSTDAGTTHCVLEDRAAAASTAVLGAFTKHMFFRRSARDSGAVFVVLLLFSTKSAAEWCSSPAERTRPLPPPVIVYYNATSRTRIHTPTHIHGRRARVRALGSCSATLRALRGRGPGEQSVFLPGRVSAQRDVHTYLHAARAPDDHPAGDTKNGISSASLTSMASHHGAKGGMCVCRARGLQPIERRTVYGVINSGPRWL